MSTPGMSSTQSQGSDGMDFTNMTHSSPSERTEGTIATMIESQTSKLPSDTFLWGAVGAMGVSAGLQLFGQKKASLFFGQWVAPMLLFGVYNKLVKQHGHDELH
jgi:hypothetical protein